MNEKREEDETPEAKQRTAWQGPRHVALWGLALDVVVVVSLTSEASVCVETEKRKRSIAAHPALAVSLASRS